MKDDKEKKEYSSFKDFIRTFLISLIVVVCIVKWIIHPVTIVGSSMYPTLEDGEYGFTNIIGTKVTELKRNEIVIVTMTDKNTGEKSQWVKRLIGLPGETIECIQDDIYIDGKKLDESSYIDETYKKQMIDTYGYFNQIPIEETDHEDTGQNVSDWGPIQLEKDEYFVMGDNRPFSADSRRQGVGPVKKTQIYGKNVFVIFPLNEMGNK